MKSFNKIITALTFSSICVAFSSNATPVVTSWDFIADSAFTSSSLTNASAAVGSDTNTELGAATKLTWGDTGGTGATSSLSVSDGTNGNNSGVITTNDASGVHTALLEHSNNPISSSFATLADATLKSKLQLFPKTPFIGGDVGIPSLEFDIDFQETLNSSASCFPGSVTICDDIFVINLTAGGATPSYDAGTGLFSFSQVFSLAEHSYTAQIIIAGLMPLGTICGEVGAPSTCIGFITGESANNQFDVSLKISVIPEPSVILLMAFALLGIVASARNKHI